MNRHAHRSFPSLGFSAASLILLLSALPVRAGYEQPCYIDGCRSADGRFVISAQQTKRAPTVHGPHEWTFTWQDMQSGQSRTFAAQGIQRGQIYAQLFLAPDGQTFALFNHVTLWSAERSEMHGPKDLPYHENSGLWRQRDEFTRRIIIYRNDGSIIKELGATDLLQPDEWESVLRVFNRVEWCAPFDQLNFKNTPRMQYAFYRVSPDYTVLEVQALPPRSKKNQPPRAIRVSLTDGRILSPDEKLTNPQKIPVRPFQDADQHPNFAPGWRENFIPSLDPIRSLGTYRVVAAEEASPLVAAPKQSKFPAGEATLIRGGYKKADTPSWLPNAFGNKTPGALVFTDLELERLYLLNPPDTITEARQGATRGKVGPDKKFYGVFDGAIATWKPGAAPEPIVTQAADGKEISLNDLAISSRGLLYFTTLKDPEKGRLSVVDVAAKSVKVLFDGEQEPTLANPNGIALSPDERFLYVGISNYKNLKHSGVYCFPIRADGTLEVDTGKAKPWAAVKSPDGIAVDKAGNVFFTAGGVVEAFDRYARPWGKIKIPQGSGTNLGFAGEQQETLYITTSQALYAVPMK